MEFRDLKTQYLKYKDEIDKAVIEVFTETNFISGKQVSDLERRMAQYVGVKNCVTCANGTDALSLVLSAWDIKKGDAVFVPNYTFFATAEVVSYVGATPIFVDVQRDTFNIDPVDLLKKVEEVINDGKLNPKVIITVDLFGLPANYKEIEKIAKKYKLLILEDAAQSFGGEMDGKRACSFGDAATTSFFPAKPLGCYGDGGAIFTNDDKLAHLLESIKVHGKGEDKYDNIRIGVNSRLDTIQAAILNIKMDAFIDHELEDVNKVYKKYNNELQGVVEIPIIPEGYYSSFAQYTILLKNRIERDSLKQYLHDRGIPTIIYYTKTMHQQLAFENLENKDSDYPISTKLCEVSLSLPMHPYLSDADILRVTSTIKRFFEQKL